MTGSLVRRANSRDHYDCDTKLVTAIPGFGNSPCQTNETVNQLPAYRSPTTFALTTALNNKTK